ncbi:MAG TPA: EamA family transporter [Thermoanaerobaculia bacterium]|nr:EamA family transporter [Thermoanaerobaculia bacterium]
MKNEKLLAYAAFGIVCLVWGTTYLAIRIAVTTVPPMMLTGTRYTIAGLIMLAVLKLRGEKLPRDRRTLIELAIVGTLLVAGGNLSVIWAEQYVPSGMAALLVATAPFWAAILEAVRKNGEQIGLRRGTGMLVGFLGVVLLVAPGAVTGNYSTKFLLGAFAIQVGSFCWQYGMVRGKHNVHGITPMQSATVQMLAGGVLVLVVGLAIGEGKNYVFTTQTFAATAYLTLFGSVIAYSAFIYALAHMKATNLSLYAYVNPAVAVVLGWLILDEKLTSMSIVAMAVILGGVAIVQTARGESKPAAPVAQEQQRAA